MPFFRIEYSNMVCRNEQMRQTENLKIVIKVATALLIMISLYFMAYQRAEKTTSDGVLTRKEKEKPCVVIDAGHGGGNLRV